MKYHLPLLSILLPNLLLASPTETTKTTIQTDGLDEWEWVDHAVKPDEWEMVDEQTSRDVHAERRVDEDAAELVLDQLARETSHEGKDEQPSNDAARLSEKDDEREASAEGEGSALDYFPIKKVASLPKNRSADGTTVALEQLPKEDLYRGSAEFPVLQEASSNSIQKVNPSPANDIDVEKATQDDFAYLNKFRYYNVHVEMDKLLLPVLKRELGDSDIRQALESAREAERVTFRQFSEEDLLVESLNLISKGKPLRPIVQEVTAIARNIIQRRIGDKYLKTALYEHHDDWEMDDLIASILSQGDNAHPRAFNLDGELAIQMICSNGNVSPISFAHVNLDDVIGPYLDPVFLPTLRYREIIQKARRIINKGKLYHNPKDLARQDDDTQLALTLPPLLEGIADSNKIRKVIHQARQMVFLNIALRRKKLFALRQLVDSPNTFPKIYFEKIVRQNFYPSCISVLEVLMQYPSLSSDFLGSLLVDQVGMIIGKQYTNTTLVVLLLKDLRLTPSAIHQAYNKAKMSDHRPLMQTFMNSGRVATIHQESIEL